MYRGLNKSDFIDGNGKIIPTTAGVSDFIQKINDDFAAFHADEAVMPDFDATFIGFRDTVTDMNAPFDTLFFSVTSYTGEGEEQVEVPETAFELPKINQGKSLGTFATGECGIDVILNYGDYILNEPDRFSFDFNYARAAEATIDLTGITDPVVRKRRKEQLFQFIDISAFYGFHCTETGKVTTTSGGSNTVHDATIIYDLVLSPFASKNTYYLYIQSDRERSYDFYNTYKIDPEEPENMLFGTTEANLIPRVYATSGWPVILESTAQEHEDLYNTICLQLVTDNNPNTVLYGQTACVDNALRNHFSTIDQLQQPADEEGNQPKLTTTIILSNPAVADGSVKKHIANFGILIYQGIVYSYIAGTEVNEANETVNVYAQPNFFDDVFGNLRAEGMMKSNYETGYSIVVNQRILLANYSYKFRQLGTSALTCLKVSDHIATGDIFQPYLGRVAYYTDLVDNSSDLLYPLKKPRHISESTTANNINLKGIREYRLAPPYFLRTKVFTDGFYPVNGLTLEVDSGSIADKVLVGLTESEHNSLTDLIDQSGFINTKIFLIDLNNNGNQFMSKELIPYEKFTLALTGENTAGELEMQTTTPLITIYSLSPNCYFTSDFSEYVQDAGPAYFKLNYLIEIDDNANS